MRHICLILLAGVSLFAQTATPKTQSAREALIEMFFGKGADDFAKHLPEDARRALIHQGETPENSTLLKISALGRQMTAEGQQVETFSVGPNILVSEQNDGRERVEIAVEHDSVLGEQEEIELSLHIYKDGQPQALPIVPSFTFVMKPEKEIWRLEELTAAAHIPLTDPDYLKELRREQDEANASAAQARISTIVSAESAYMNKHSDGGFTCSLTDLFAGNSAVSDTSSSETSGSDPSDNAQTILQLFDPGQGSNDYNGYRFTITGCDGKPTSKYRVTAVPSDDSSSAKTFCADESGKLKSGETSAACFSRGEVVNTGPAPLPSFSID
jgi:hypothetical protein